MILWAWYWLRGKRIDGGAGWGMLAAFADLPLWALLAVLGLGLWG